MNNRKEFTDLRSAISLALNALDRDGEDGKPVRKEMADELRKAFGNFIEASERATTASAAPTIDTPEFREQFAYMLRTEYASLVGLIDQHASARAEEARREARAELIRETAFAMGRRHAQRTAGGDAVALRAALKAANDTIREITFSGPAYPAKIASKAMAGIAAALAAQPAAGAAQVDDVAQVREALSLCEPEDQQAFERVVTASEYALNPSDDALFSVVFAQPVAEAAAQADDWIHAEMADIETEAVVSLPRKELVAHYKQARADLAHWKRRALGGAPTAQPTPQIIGCVAREAPSPYVALDTAQPTLPDDERAAFEQWAISKLLVSEYFIGFDKGKYVSNFVQAAWLSWQEAQARAALRQPGALPDEMTPEMMRAVQIKSELGAYACANLSGAYDLFQEFWTVALAAKQAGKEAS